MFSVQTSSQPRSPFRDAGGGSCNSKHHLLPPLKSHNSAKSVSHPIAHESSMKDMTYDSSKRGEKYANHLKSHPLHSTACTSHRNSLTLISLLTHSKPQSLTIPVVICVSVSIFLCVHSCVLYVRWEVKTQHFTNICT